jgi:hypothetical protein
MNDICNRCIVPAFDGAFVPQEWKDAMGWPKWRSFREGNDAGISRKEDSLDVHHRGRGLAGNSTASLRNTYQPDTASRMYSTGYRLLKESMARDAVKAFLLKIGV